nr:class I SAM-dependent methyltransferase [Clostridia bacterium]
MGEFFDSRLCGYDEHMLKNIESAEEFYEYTAAQLPHGDGVHILDLGCGTGLELEKYFKLAPDAHVTGIDLAPGMLGALKKKFHGFDIDLICGSYFDVPFGIAEYDAAVSVESLHHFTQEMKIQLYIKLRESLKDGGYFILTDYFSLTEDEELGHFAELERLKKEQGIDDGEFYHYDTPLTVEHECEALKFAGFSSVEVLNRWGATCTVKAVK